VQITSLTVYLDEAQHGPLASQLVRAVPQGASNVSKLVIAAGKKQQELQQGSAVMPDFLSQGLNEHAASGSQDHLQLGKISTLVLDVSAVIRPPLFIRYCNAGHRCIMMALE
jgi:hypothetical protein